MILTTSWQQIKQTTVGSTGYGHTVYLRHYARYSSQEINNNRSYVYHQTRLYVSGNGYFSAGATTQKYISGIGTTQNNVDAAGTYNAGETTLLSQEGWLTHNSSGVGSVTLTGRFRSTPWGWDKSVSTTVTLPTIPRQANITGASNRTDEEDITFTYSNPAGNAVSTLQARLTFTDGTEIKGYENVSKTGSSHTISLTEAQRNVIRSKYSSVNSGAVRIQLRTNLGSNYYSTRDITISIINSNPTVDSNFWDKMQVDAVDSLTLSLVNNSKTIIKDISKVEVKDFGKFSGTKGSSIVSITLSNGGKVETYTAAQANGTIELPKVSSREFIITAIDTRGNSVSTTFDIDNFIDYRSPTLVTYDGDRVNPQSDEVAVEVFGTFDSVNFGQVLNTPTLSYRSRIKSEDYDNTWINESLTIDGNTYEFNGNLGGFDVANSYEIEVRIIDAINKPIYRTFDISSGGYNITYATNGGIAVNSVYDYDLGGALQVEGDLMYNGSPLELSPNMSELLNFFYPVGTLYETTSSNLNTVAKMNSHFGGTWESYGQGRVTVGYNTSGTFNSIGKTGGAETHTLTIAQMPRHRHTTNMRGYADGTLEAGWGATNRAQTTYTGYEGGGQAHNNLQPYIVVYRYRRVS